MTDTNKARADMVQLIRDKRDNDGAPAFHNHLRDYPRGGGHSLGELFNDGLPGNEDFALLLAVFGADSSVRGATMGRRLVVPGKPDESLLYRLVTDTPDRQPFMAGRFTDADREVVRKWIESLPAEEGEQAS